MATTIVPILNIKLSGKGLVTELDKSYTFNSQTKKEQTFSLNSADDYETFDITNISDIRYLMFFCDTEFDLKVTTTTEVSIIRTSVYVLNPSTTYMSTVTSIEIKATSDTTKQIIEARAYGV